MRRERSVPLVLVAKQRRHAVAIVDGLDGAREERGNRDYFEPAEAFVLRHRHSVCDRESPDRG